MGIDGQNVWCVCACVFVLSKTCWCCAIDVGDDSGYGQCEKIQYAVYCCLIQDVQRKDESGGITCQGACSLYGIGHIL